ncbi:DEAD/DEAH box helicase [Brevibacillus dissolubilis]|uniref:DEAD/DEAH box helicase n=1 Tax=Brevibacillus dissolubilis TaxID=1844116 RepID=UPI0011179D4D|nr:DEAD/DEAH box helicase [Brevibacillus dissolubilis]
MEQAYENIYNHPTLNRVINELQKGYLYKTQLNKHLNLQMSFKEEIQKAGWLATILADSDNESHKQKAQIFAALLYLVFKEDINCNQLSYIIFSRTGNLVATKFLDSLFESDSSDIASSKFRYNFGAVLDIELGYKRHVNTILLNNRLSILATDFQRMLWDILFENNKISISAPTSSGKSFVIKSFINMNFAKKQSYSVLYIAPTKALLNQVSEEFRSTLDRDVNVRTAFIDKEFLKNNSLKNIFILTPERCLKLLQNADQYSIVPDFVFVDEIQNVEDENGRGILMEFVLDEISKKWRSSKIVTAGPYIKRNNALFVNLFGTDSVEVQTTLSPVFQIRCIVKPDIEKNQICLFYKSLTEKNSKLNINIPANFNVKKEFDSHVYKSVTKSVKVLGNVGQSIVYAARADYAERWAMELSGEIDTINGNSEIDELIEYLTEEIHPKYFLIKCLKAGVAFHHSKLPDIVRREIENQFSRGLIKYLCCTSTLIQGVNLPANNLFVVSPKKKTENLSLFEFGNLMGRAGRIKDSLYGTIYCIEKNEWADEYLNRAYEKEVIPASNKSLSNIESILNNIDKPTTEINNACDGFTISLLRHKFISSEKEFNQYLQKKGVHIKDKTKIIEKFKDTLSNITLNSKVISLNPSIDPMLQDRLYKEILKDGLSKWVIIPNSNFNKRMNKDKIQDLKYHELPFYWQLVNTIEKLDSIFSIKNEAFRKHDIKHSLRRFAFFSIRWLQSNSYREIIDEEISFSNIELDNERLINKKINEVVNVHSKIVTFLLVKYYKLLTDILDFIMSEAEKEKYKLTLSLPIMLELGTMEPIAIQLISAGVTRSVAIRVLREFKKVSNYEQLDVFEWLENNGSRMRIKPIYLKYLRELNLIK